MAQEATILSTSHSFLRLKKETLLLLIFVIMEKVGEHPLTQSLSKISQKILLLFSLLSIFMMLFSLEIVLAHLSRWSFTKITEKKFIKWFCSPSSREDIFAILHFSMPWLSVHLFLSDHFLDGVA